MRLNILFLLVFVVLLGGCIAPSFVVDDFDVDYYASYTSPSGDRVLDINYIVENGVIVSCSGNYTYPAGIDYKDHGITSLTEPCDVDRLNLKDYNVPLRLVTSLHDTDRLSKEVAEGPSIYRYTINLK